MDLWVGVEVTHTLDVHHNQLVAGTLKSEVAEGLWGDMKEKVTTRDQAVGCTNTGRHCSERFQHPTSAHVGGLYAGRSCTEAKTKEGALPNSEGPEVC